MNDTVKMGVVGAGVFGGYHSAKLAAHERVTFQGVFDPDMLRANGLARKHGVTAYKDYAQLLASVEAVVIACPASLHGEMAVKALEQGVHCLIEKPIAPDLAAAQQIVKISRSKNLTVQIGHQERFVAKAIGLDKISERPLKIVAERLGPRSDRGGDVSVTLDLMTHDLDLILMLMEEMPSTIAGYTETIYTPFSDKTKAQLIFGDTEVFLSASRVAPDYSRIMTLTYPSGDVVIDFNAKALRNDTAFELNTAFAQSSDVQDSLGAATDCFVRAVLDKTPVVITAQDGLNALELALAIDTR